MGRKDPFDPQNFPTEEELEEQVKRERERDKERRAQQEEDLAHRRLMYGWPTPERPEARAATQNILDAITYGAEQMWAAKPGVVEVELWSEEPQAVEALKRTIAMLPGGGSLVKRERDGKWILCGGDTKFLAFACENQGYVKKVIR